MCCNHLLASLWPLSASEILHHAIRLLRRAAYYSASCLSASVPPLSAPLKPAPYTSVLPSLYCVTSRTRPSVKCLVGQCIRNRSDQLCAASVGAPSNISEHPLGPASQVFLAIVLRLGGYQVLWTKVLWQRYCG